MATYKIVPPPPPHPPQKMELQIWTHHKINTWRHRTYLFVYPKSFTNGTSSALASWRAHVTNLVFHFDVLEQQIGRSKW
jgi:hypothetical protein